MPVLPRLTKQVDGGSEGSRASSGLVSAEFTEPDLVNLENL